MAREPEELASIDELLAGDTDVDAEADADAAGPGRGATLASQVFWSALLAAIGAAAVYVVLLPLGYKIPYPLLFSVFFALVAVRRAARTVAAPKLRVGAMPAASPARIDPTEVPDGIELALGRWEARLAWTERDPARFMSNVRPRLAEIADERLRQRHGVTRAGDPRRARELMGERLWTFLFSPLARNPNPGELAAVVDDMEKI